MGKVAGGGGVTPQPTWDSAGSSGRGGRMPTPQRCGRYSQGPYGRQAVFDVTSPGNILKLIRQRGQRGITLRMLVPRS